jgi:uncharacterized protein (TIGR03382 family)
MPVAYRRYLVTPDDPLPPLALVEVMAGPAYPVARFMTTDKLDRQNCATAPPPFGGICQPPLHDCIADAAVPPPTPDAGATDVPASGDAAGEAASPDAPPPPTDTATAPDATILAADTALTLPADASATTATRSGGCSAGGAGSQAPWLVLLLLAVARPRTRTPRVLVSRRQ